jgi:hypothetical protein
MPACKTIVKRKREQVTGIVPIFDKGFPPSATNFFLSNFKMAIAYELVRKKIYLTMLETNRPRVFNYR